MHLSLRLVALAGLGFVAACAPVSATEEGADGDDGVDEPVDTCPLLALSAEAVTWAEAPLGEDSLQTLTLTNDCEGDGDLSLEMVLAGGPFSGDIPGVAILAPGESLDLEIAFAPTSYDDATGRLEIRAGADDALTEVALQGSVDRDADNDGDDAMAAGGTDCDDANPEVYGRAVEEAQDGVDDDCDGTVDEDFVLAGDVLINEIMVDPAIADEADGEWIELRSRLAFDLDLFGWTLAANDGEEVVITESVILPAGGFVVLGASDEPARNGGAGVDYAYVRDDFSLANVEDSILLRIGDREIASVAWDTFWPVSEGRSIELDADLASADTAPSAAYWCSADVPYGDGDLGSPGSDNGRCDSVDHDGDGVPVSQGDCDDDDGTRAPTIPEVWDGIDNNCDGLVDDLDVDSAVGVIEGDSAEFFTWNHALATADLDGDGTPEVLVGASGADAPSSGTFYGQGEVLAIPAADALVANDTARNLSSWSVEGGSITNRLATLFPEMGDLDGDGTDDFVVTGQTSSTEGAVVVLLGDSGLSGGTYDEDDADFTVNGSQTSADNSRSMGAGDFDGDGLVDLIYANAIERYSSSTWQAGSVRGWSGDTVESGGTEDYEDSEMYLYLNQTSALLGSGLGYGDLDNDGYDDLIAAAPGLQGTKGTVYMLEGSSNPWRSGFVNNLSDWELNGVQTAGYLGRNAIFHTGDYDNDGKLDLLVGSPVEGRAYFLSDTTTLADSDDIDDAATIIFAGSTELAYGQAVAAGDVDGDGSSEIVVGAPDTRYLQSGFDATVGGAVYVYDLTTTGTGTVSTTQSAFSLTGVNIKDAFGAVLHTSDLDGDGDDELLVGAPRANTTNGALYLFNP